MAQRITASVPKKLTQQYRWRRNPVDIKVDTKLSDPFTGNSANFFLALGLEMDFLKKDPSEWPNQSDYQVAYDLVRTLQVTNEVAERGVALTKPMLGLTKNESSFQNLLLVTHHDRKLNKLS
ncbi:hypothetical protein FOCC_FOCC015274 [Frankliniella occidentalis]|nr:hypothetical protein FOCC_FOCC015274 [Frankliniella occidentalis]